MTNTKPLSAKQLAVMEDLFVGRLEEPEIRENHNISRKLYEKWLADENFNSRLDQRKAWEYRRCEFMLARKTRQTVSMLVKLAELGKGETARKACIDIITMRANLLAGAPVTPGDNPTPPPESPNLQPEAAGKILAVLAEENQKDL